MVVGAQGPERGGAQDRPALVGSSVAIRGDVYGPSRPTALPRVRHTGRTSRERPCGEGGRGARGALRERALERLPVWRRPLCGVDSRAGRGRNGGWWRSRGV
jgi:hypothetical protein